MTAKKYFLSIAIMLAGMLTLSACSETQLVSHWMKKVTWPGQQESAGTYKVGSAYSVGGTWYRPEESFDYVETGIASWYGPNFDGHRTANGEIYDQDELTAAHRTLQMPCLVRVTNLENGRSVVVRINDRGPYMRGRIIDVSKRAAELLGFIGKGTARVRVAVLSKESREIAEAAKRGEDTSRLTMADLERYDTGSPVASATPVAARSTAPAQSFRTQVARNDVESSLPESLQTPSITVEELNQPGSGASVVTSPSSSWRPAGNSRTASAPVSSGASTAADTRAARKSFVSSLGLDDDANTASNNGDMASGHMENGHFMPDPVVTQEPVVPTGIYVQAGAFGVYGNAQRLKEKLSSIAPVIIEPITTSTGKTLYRVKLGPLSSVDRADSVLNRVIAAGGDGARVVHRH
jgi:rare lipoprotein A